MNHLSTSALARRLARVEHSFATEIEALIRCLIELESEIDPAAIPQRDDAFHHRMARAFQESEDACRRFEEAHADDPTAVLDAQDTFRQLTEPWFRHSWFSHRARSKPSGFAGDYEMLLKLYEQKTPALGLGGYLDLCFVDIALAQAVRTRLAAVQEFLVEEIQSRKGDVRILNIACGPCREFEDWPHSGNGKVEVVAIDNDPNALEYVDTHVVTRLNGSLKIQAQRYNALRTRVASANRKKFGTFDIIYSVGLCDYLSDEHLHGMLNAWWETLNEDGVLYVAFKDAERYDKTPYQWHLDWFFIQRTYEDVLGLYERAGIGRNAAEVRRDASGIIMNFITRRTPTKYFRTDAAETSISPLVNEAGRESARPE